MLKIFSLAIMICSYSVVSIAAQNFGEGADKAKLVSISKLLENPKDFTGKSITVSGTIVSVCKNRGCWMKFASDKKYQTLRIKVKDGKMVFPISLRGKKGFATGTLRGMTLPKERAIKYLAHMAEESGEKFDAKSITGPHIIYQLVPTGVTIE